MDASCGTSTAYSFCAHAFDPGFFVVFVPFVPVYVVSSMLWCPLRYPLCSDVRFVLTPHWFCREFLFFVCLTRFPYQLMLLSFNRTTGWMSLVETLTFTGHLTTPHPCFYGFIVLNLLSLLCGLFFELRFSEYPFGIFKFPSW